VHHELEVVATVEDVLAEIPGLVRLVDVVPQAPDDVQHLAAHVNEGVGSPDGVRRDDRALDEDMRVG
jgi:hypothetical protein